MAEIYRAKEPFTFTGHSGLPRTFTPHGDNSLIADDDPDFKGREHLFEPAVAAANRAAETASAAPGERRARPRLRSDASEKPARTEHPAQPESPASE
ncbi:hypothetical protein [Mycobacterium palustre]|uniref:Uncharacterized protein n=1 Tax=Mycobacterium palustre TaxID=153971 RepID=A0A1X1ZCA7_9MYCO|nr:hypothetical protein [Mycobacterium palustre]MCV7100077.1 hypothetical protein [Mycobacterium palustre]ORW20915.1 hypothetical protein AWC19_14200 [Mycobacterium palustre]